MLRFMVKTEVMCHYYILSLLLCIYAHNLLRSERKNNHLTPPSNTLLHKFLWFESLVTVNILPGKTSFINFSRHDSHDNFIQYMHLKDLPMFSRNHNVCMFS